jgi:hypothetical protein
VLCLRALAWIPGVRAGGMAQVVEGLSSKYEALSSNPNTIQQQQQQKQSTGVTRIIFIVALSPMKTSLGRW